MIRVNNKWQNLPGTTDYDERYPKGIGFTTVGSIYNEKFPGTIEESEMDTEVLIGVCDWEDKPHFEITEINDNKLPEWAEKKKECLLYSTKEKVEHTKMFDIQDDIDNIEEKDDE